MADAAAPVITIDGPSGAGKGTLAAALARRLGWHALDSGVVYRTLAWELARRGDGDDAAAALAEGLAARLSWPARGPALDGRALGDSIRGEQIAARASRLAASPAVRRALLDAQRRCRREPGLVADGRDMGSVVFPDAAVKLFLDAEPAVRARRRASELACRRAAPDPDAEPAIRARDAQDRARADAPLRRTPDMRLIDSTALDPEQVFEQAWRWVSPRLGAGAPARR